jgi:hypothetical protein
MFWGGNVVPFPPMPGYFLITKETWTWKVPEPTTLSLFALGLAGVGFMRRRKAIGSVGVMARRGSAA